LGGLKVEKLAEKKVVYWDIQKVETLVVLLVRKLELYWEQYSVENSVSTTVI
jgi:hypothetical protein